MQRHTYEDKIKVPVILGPTAVGKSDIALRAAERFGYDILSCDSRQIYRGMNIGTAKPSMEEMGRVKHWLVDILEPSEQYSAFAFASDALRIIRNSYKIGKKILICGGTGLYYDILLNGVGSTDEADLEFRNRLTDEAREFGNAVLHERLRTLDPISASKIHPNNLRRLIRALDIYYKQGRSFSSLRENRDQPEDIEFHAVVITRPREILYDRINRRVEAMFERGLWEEFMALRRTGYAEDSPGMVSVGYRELFDVLSGKIDINCAMELIKRNTRHYAKRQLTWFRNKTSAKNIDVTDSDNSLYDLIF